MLNQINLNTNNAFTSEIQNKPKTQDQTKKNNNLFDYYFFCLIYLFKI